VHGVVIAGGLGTRLGGAKATAPLAGRPLVAHGLAALRAVCERVAVVARPDTPLPGDLGVPVWLEAPDAPRHPRTGLVTALERAEVVLVLAVDLPLVPPAFLARLAAAGAVAESQPLCGAYARATDLAALRAAPADEPLRATVARLGRPELAAPPGALLNVNTPADLERAAMVLDGRPGWT
jgi:molybdopterin-guanine dinucleotide biosynthesis protein A